jgi:hypothetical protein
MNSNSVTVMPKHRAEVSAPNKPHRRAERTSIVLTAVVLGIALIGGTAAKLNLPITPATASVQSQKLFYPAVSKFDTKDAEAHADISTADANITKAKALLASSNGRTIDQSARTTLSDDITTAEKQTATAKATVAKWDATRHDVTRAGADTTKGLTHSAETLSITGSVSLSVDLSKDEAAVTNAVSAWQAQQAAIAAAKAKAAAEAQAAERARTVSAPRSASRGSGPYAANVWTASGFQSSIDDCRGVVDVTSNYGLRAVAEEWGCGGAGLYYAAAAPGSVIILTGIDAGTYRSSGVVSRLNANTGNADEIARGYDLIYQTCLNGNASTEVFIGLTKIG